MYCRLAPVAFTLVVAAASAATGHAQSWGPSHLPSRFSQYLGWGYGAGHHAPIVRTPGLHPPRTPRWIVHAAADGPLYVAPYRPLGCYSEVCPAVGESPTSLLPTAAPTSAPPDRVFVPALHGGR